MMWDALTVGIFLPSGDRRAVAVGPDPGGPGRRVGGHGHVAA